MPPFDEKRERNNGHKRKSAGQNCGVRKGGTSKQGPHPKREQRKIAEKGFSKEIRKILGEVDGGGGGGGGGEGGGGGGGGGGVWCWGLLSGKRKSAQGNN